MQYLHINGELGAQGVGGGVVFRILAAKDVNTSPKKNQQASNRNTANALLVVRLCEPAHFTHGKLACARTHLLHPAGGVTHAVCVVGVFVRHTGLHCAPH